MYEDERGVKMFIVEMKDGTTIDSNEKSWGYIDMPNVVKLKMVIEETKPSKEYSFDEKPENWQEWVYFREGLILGLSGGKAPIETGEAIGYSDGIVEHVLFYDLIKQQLVERTYPHGTHKWYLSQVSK